MDVPAGLLTADAVRLDVELADREEAIRYAGRLLVEVGAVPDAYVGSMLQRERTTTTNLGRGFAIPHGSEGSQALVLRDALCVVRLARPVPWGASEVDVAVGIAAQGDAHAPALGRLARLINDPAQSAALRAETDPEAVVRLLVG
ncbi:PTS sugar transporter subunit IIA [Solicola sp. PLA-1-18]|uniref:PTS sugar transporter subunit IIA n=1 Tax=Solicola sp. PLA-1-18 TaxID=3380532 RepID=UPI003B824877